MALTVFREHTAIIKGTATTAQTLPEKIALLSSTDVAGSAVGTVSASTIVSDAATTTATPHTPTDAITLTATAVAGEWVAPRYVVPGDIPAWQ